jgi:hypothetical protein
MNTRTRAALRVLRDVLHLDAQCARRLVEVGHALTRALVDADPDRIEQLQLVADTVAERQIANDARRAAAAQAVAEALGMAQPPDAQPPALAEIVRALPAPDARPIVEIRERILGLHLELTMLNDRNQRLIENFRNCTHATVEVLVNAASRPQTYGPSGRAKAPTVFVDQAA